MNTPRRVLVITRYFWPSISDSTLRLQHWVQQLRREGSEVCVLTPRWHDSWPRKVVCDEIPVVRLDHPPTHPLRGGRYQRQLGQWLAQAAAGYDLIYCDQPDLEASAILTQFADLPRPPVVVRFDAQWADAGSLLGRPSAKALDVCRRAAVVLAADSTAHQQLLACGIKEDSILRAPPLTGLAVDRSPQARGKARQILSEINHDLFVRSSDRLIVCPGELTRQWSIDLLVRGLTPLIEKHRSLHVWILGDSHERPRLYDLLRDAGLHRLVAMPGIFTDLEQILQVADLCIFPASGQGLNWLLPSCIASSVGVLVSDSLEARQQLGAQAGELTFAAEQPLSLRERVSDWWRDPTPVSLAVSRVQQRSVASSGTALSHELFQRLEARA